MSNFLAPAAVTTVLQHVIQGALQGKVNGATVKALRPDDVPPGQAKDTWVNVFLYHVEANPHWRNHDLPTRGGAGQLTERPTAALDLRYLLTFYGKEDTLDPQQLLGVTVQALHAEPLLSRKKVREILGGLEDSHPARESDLAEQIDVVRFTPIGLNLEELSKLWSVFFQTKYHLSVAYQAGVVLIDADDQPGPALPVRSRGPRTSAGRPRLARIEPPDPTYAAGAQVVLTGTGLVGATTTVRFDGEEATPDAQASSDTRLVVPLPLGVRAGVHLVRVVHTGEVEEVGPRPLAESNAVPVAVRPRITSVVSGISLSPGELSAVPVIIVAFEPELDPEQDAFLLLNELDAPSSRPPRTYRIQAWREKDPTTDLTFPREPVEAGDYLARLVIDDVESLLETDEDGRYAQPEVNVP